MVLLSSSLLHKQESSLMIDQCIIVCFILKDQEWRVIARHGSTSGGKESYYQGNKLIYYTADFLIDCNVIYTDIHYIAITICITGTPSSFNCHMCHHKWKWRNTCWIQRDGKLDRFAAIPGRVVTPVLWHLIKLPCYPLLFCSTTHTTNTTPHHIVCIQLETTTDFHPNATSFLLLISPPVLEKMQD